MIKKTIGDGSFCDRVENIVNKVTADQFLTMNHRNIQTIHRKMTVAHGRI